MRRLVTAPLSLGALALLLVLAGPGAGRSLSLNGPQLRAKGLVPALIRRWDGMRLTLLDEQTLRRKGRASAPLGFVDTWAFSHASPSLVVLATRTNENDEKGSLRFANVASRRLVERTVPLAGGGRALLWARPDHVVAIVDKCCAGASELVVVDPGSRRVVSRQELPGSVTALARGSSSLVMLMTPRGQIGPARLDVVGDDGSLRSVALDRVIAGSFWPTGAEQDPIGKFRVPALVVDPAGQRAYVMQADGPAADVDLRTLAVSYHVLTVPKSLFARFGDWLSPPALAKGGNGPHRSGTWLGDGLIAITGTDEQASRDPNGTMSMSVTPSGLAIVDTHDWTIRTLDRGADAVMPVDGLLLATGSRWSSDGSAPTGMGVAAYGADRKLRFHVLDGRSTGLAAAMGGRAYVYVNGQDGISTVDVVDLATGRIVGEHSPDLPTLLLGDARVG
jgi:hypothetical protein